MIVYLTCVIVFHNFNKKPITYEKVIVILSVVLRTKVVQKHKDARAQNQVGLTTYGRQII